jgi:hypothetical protein
VGTAGELAVFSDMQWLPPAPLPAAALPVQTGLAAVIGTRPLLHYCRAQDAPSILSTGLWPGSWCTITALSGLVADMWLGTPRRKDYVLMIDPAAVAAFHGPGSAPGDPGDPLRLGGAIEIYLPSGAPPGAIIGHGHLEDR